MRSYGAGIRRSVATAVIGVLVALAAGCTTPVGGPTSAPARRPATAHRPLKVIVYGDSLTWEARRYFPQLAPALDVQVTERSFIGTAICDWIADAWTRIPKQHPDVVVVAFYGNSWTHCMSDGRGGYLQNAAKALKYQDDADAMAAIAMASGAHLVLAGAPRSSEQMDDRGWQRVRAAYRNVAAWHPGWVTYADAGADIAPGGRYVATRPCLASERSIVDPNGTRPCQNGQIIVRALDGVHFCPQGADWASGTPGDCPRYMSGAFRYATALLTAAHTAGTHRTGTAVLATVVTGPVVYRF